MGKEQDTPRRRKRIFRMISVHMPEISNATVESLDFHPILYSWLHPKQVNAIIKPAV